MTLSREEADFMAILTLHESHEMRKTRKLIE